MSRFGSPSPDCPSPTARSSPWRFFADLSLLEICAATGRPEGTVKAQLHRGLVRGLRQNAGTAFRPGTRSMLLRAQAMAIVLVTSATVGFGSVADLAATQHVAQHVVDRLEGPSDGGSVTSPAAPPMPVTAPTEQLETLQAYQRRGDPDAEGKPGSLEVPGQACGLPAHAEADHLQGSVWNAARMVLAPSGHRGTKTAQGSIQVTREERSSGRQGIRPEQGRSSGKQGVNTEQGRSSGQ
jgi:hypothetical protein